MMIKIETITGDVIETNDGDLNFWMQRMSTTDIQLIKEKNTGGLILVNPKYITMVTEVND
ncbi:hypothetical protein [Lactobacillus sp. PV034]|uniref:hypothetical protein n=1 Tax=Lactobacillus sp. PV034 TaxID=2594495 RepID=UPI00224054A8|nr:hypothetical protein [Lactobacillus sp. PV034]QNQ80798.1 hypothetical protein FP432_04135 [Lactobacillus sp. PV034]